MLFYFAPMEGITSYIYRNIHQELFDSVDKYFMPFISPTEMHGFKKKELRDILPEHNQNISVVHKFCQTVQTILFIPPKN